MLGCFCGQQYNTCKMIIYCVWNGIHESRGGQSFITLSCLKEEPIAGVEFSRDFAI